MSLPLKPLPLRRVHVRRGATGSGRRVGALLVLVPGAELEGGVVGRRPGGGVHINAEADALGAEMVLKDRLRAGAPQPARPLFALGEVEIGRDVSLRGDERVTPSDDAPPSGKDPGASRLHLVPRLVDGPEVVLLIQLTDPGRHTIRDNVAVGVCVQRERRSTRTQRGGTQIQCAAGHREPGTDRGPEGVGHRDEFNLHLSGRGALPWDYCRA
jgi:hypothetical protein